MEDTQRPESLFELNNRFAKIAFGTGFDLLLDFENIVIDEYINLSSINNNTHFYK